MVDFLVSHYNWIKAMHVIAAMAWMAGLFYLPRLFAYHADAVAGSFEPSATLAVMERRLLRIIMNPAMTGTWLFGFVMILTPGMIDWQSAWPHVKAVAVLALTLFHMWLARKRKELLAGNCRTAARQFRLMNEIPTVLAIVIVIMAVVEPF